MSGPLPGLDVHGNVSAWCVTAERDHYRYLLGRSWTPTDGPSPEVAARPHWERPHTLPIWAIIMMNPSIARHDVDDQTIRKVTGFVKQHGGGGYVVANLAGWSATHPSDMLRAWKRGTDIVGAHNALAIEWTLRRAWTTGGGVLAAWGSLIKTLRPVLASSVLHVFRHAGSDLQCLGTSRDGCPRHPLVLAYSTPLARYENERMWTLEAMKHETNKSFGRALAPFI